MAANRLKHGEYVILVKIVVCAKNLATWANTRTKKKNKNKRNKLPFLTSAALKIIYRERNENKDTRDQGFDFLRAPTCGIPRNSIF